MPSKKSIPSPSPSLSIYTGDNLAILRSFPAKSVDLIYIDPPFNTGEVQARTTLKTCCAAGGDRIGFKGKRYATVALVLAAAYFASTWLCREMLSRNIVRLSKRFYGVSEFCYYALADGIAALCRRYGKWKGMDAS